MFCRTMYSCVYTAHPIIAYRWLSVHDRKVLKIPLSGIDILTIRPLICYAFCDVLLLNWTQRGCVCVLSIYHCSIEADQSRPRGTLAERIAARRAAMPHFNRRIFFTAFTLLLLLCSVFSVIFL